MNDDTAQPGAGDPGARDGEVTLTISPIDPTAPGSYRKRQRILDALAKISAIEGMNDIRDAQDMASVAKALEAFNAIEDIVRAQAQPTNGYTIDEALDLISADQFDLLLRGLLASPL